MEQVIIANATTGITSFGNSAASLGWMVTVIVFVLTILILILVFKNIRRIIYGSIISGIVIGVYHFSRWIGTSTQNKDYVPISWFLYIAGFLICSWLIGLWLDKNKILDKIEAEFDKPIIKEIKKNKQ